MATLLGKNLQISKNTTGSTYAAVVAMAKSCDVQIDGDAIETSSPSDGQWKHVIAGRKSWSVNVSFLVPSGTFPTEAAMVNTPSPYVSATARLRCRARPLSRRGRRRERLETWHKCLAIIYEAYLKNGSMTLTDNQRKAAYEEYKRERE